MNIELSLQTEERIQGLLAGGVFSSADEVIDAGVMLLDLKSKIHEGVDDIAAGRVTSFETNEELGDYFEDVKKR